MGRITRRARLFGVGLAALLLVAVAPSAEAALPKLGVQPLLQETLAPIYGAEDATRWIMVLDAGINPHDLIIPTLEQLDIHIDGVFVHASNTIVVEAPKKLLANTTGLYGLAFILEDTVAAVIAPAVSNQQVPAPVTETAPPNIRRIGGPSVAATDLDADIAIIDTGIDPHHSDLNVVGGKDCSLVSRPAVLLEKPWADVNGHGTLVASTAAARRNGTGFIGVAPGARLWAVKVAATDVVRSDLEPGPVYLSEITPVPTDPYFDPGLSNVYMSSFLCAFDYVVAQKAVFEAVNMSIGGVGTNDPCDGMANFLGLPVPWIVQGYVTTAQQVLVGSSRANLDLLQEALCRVVQAGVPLVASAGNEAAAVNGPDSRQFPAGFPGVIGVSGIADSDGLAGGLGGDRIDICGSYYFPRRLRETVPPVGETLFGPGNPEGHFDEDDTFANFSNFGARIAVAAVATCAVGARPGGGYNAEPGTSFAAPAVAGAVALIRAKRPHASIPDIRALLRSTGVVDYDTSQDPDGIPDPRIDIPRLEAALAGAPDLPLP